MTLAWIHGAIIAFFLLLGALAPRRPGSPWDTVLNLANGTLLGGLRILGAAAIGAAAASGLPRIDLGAVTHPLLQFLAVFLIADFARYWLHYAHHRVDALWRFHRVHHSSRHLDATSGLRMHIVDFVQLAVLPVVLFGVLFDVSSFDARVWPALVIATDVFDAIQHANLKLDLHQPWTRAWDRLFNNPVFHSWHHSTDPGEYNGNYGQALTVWDRIFGTHIAHAEAAPEFGLPAEEQIEHSLLGLHLLRAREPVMKGREAGRSN